MYCLLTLALTFSLEIRFTQAHGILERFAERRLEATVMHRCRLHFINSINLDGGTAADQRQMTRGTTFEPTDLTMESQTGPRCTIPVDLILYNWGTPLVLVPGIIDIPIFGPL